MKQIFLTAAVFLFTIITLNATDVVWFDGTNPVSYCIVGKHEVVVGTAAGMFASDMEAVTGLKAVSAAENKAAIRLIELDKASSSAIKTLQKDGIDVESLRQKTDGFDISVKGGQITVVGTNGLGTAYGLLELSRMAGVSPWIWWGDVVPEKRSRLTIDSDFHIQQGASVEYRGIFINDEDWTLRHWSYSNYDPAPFGHVGVKTYRRVFELLLRLRANAIWPAMHTGTTAFFKIEGAKAVADSCGIAIGSSHCEPLLRNNLDEWDESVRGRYNYITNRSEVQDYWAERLREVKGSAGGNMFTIGMRGIHDGSMEGVKTMNEKFTALQQVIDDQQQLISKYIGDPSKQIQVFVPYKEVLQIYERGLKVPDCVTLMWCDDNYGYMTRLSDEEEQQRSGGGGIYYHLSYWGSPHDYLWLTTMQPGLMYNEMKQAYDHNVRKLWIVNVHDPKVAGYDLELYLDLAWNMESFSGDKLEQHLQNWLCRQFGQRAGEQLFPAMKKYYQLCGERHPEFMGWSQTECDKKLYDRGNTPVRNTQFSQTAFGNELQQYLDSYQSISDVVRRAESLIRPELKDAYFAAIEYPVWCAAANATKILESQKARQWASGSTRSNMFENDDNIRLSCARAQKAYIEIAKLTDYYNNEMSGGKWHNSMNMRPRDLPVYGAPVLPLMLSDNEVDELLKNGTGELKTQAPQKNVIARNACNYDSSSEGCETIQMLGHSMQAVALPKDGKLTYSFEMPKAGIAKVLVAVIPTQANDKGDIRFGVSIDGGTEQVFTLKEPFRSEQWKLNVLRGQALRSFEHNFTEGSHTLTIHAIDDHIVADQWMIDPEVNRSFYLIPAE